jgi:hypothetical protein
MIPWGMSDSVNLDSTTSVIDALGGTAAVGRLTERRDTAVSNWRSSDCFPSNTYLVMKGALAAIGKSAPDSLWGMTPLSRKRAQRVQAEATR